MRRAFEHGLPAQARGGSFILAVALLGFMAVRRGQPGTPPPAYLQRLGPLAGLASYIAVALAVYVFA